MNYPRDLYYCWFNNGKVRNVSCANAWRNETERTNMKNLNLKDHASYVSWQSIAAVMLSCTAQVWMEV